MREITSLFLAFSIAIALSLFLLGASTTVGAQESNPDDEEWTDGPGDFTEWNIEEEYGIPPDAYFQMWSGDEDDKEKELEERREELQTHMEENLGMDHMERINAISMWEYSTQLDHGFVEAPSVLANIWNQNDARNFAPTSTTSKVPEDVEPSDGGPFQDHNVIKDAYIVEQSIHPSVTMYNTRQNDEGEWETRTERYVMAGAEIGDVDWYETPPYDSQGRIGPQQPTASALVDYRIDPPEGWSVREDSHGVTTYRVSDAMCLIGDDGEDWNPDGEDGESDGGSDDGSGTQCGVWGKNDDVSDQTPTTTYQIKRNGDYPHEWDSGSGRGGNIDDRFSFERTIDFVHEAQIEAIVYNEDSGEEEVVTHTVRHPTTVRVNTFDNIYLQTAETPDGNVQAHVFNPEPWHYISVASDVNREELVRYGVTTGWEYFTQRDTRFDTMTEMSEDDETEVGSEVQPVDVYAYPGSVGPVPWPKDQTIRDRITIRDYQSAERPPPELEENHEFPEAVDEEYSGGLWTLFEYNPDNLPEGASATENFVAYGMVDGVSKYIDEPNVKRELTGTNLEMEPVDENYDLEEDDSVTVRFTLTTDDGEPINTREAPAPLFEELDPSEPRIEISHSGQTVYTDENGEAVVDIDLSELDEDTPVTAQFKPHEWYLVEEDAEVFEKSTATLHQQEEFDSILDRVGHVFWRALYTVIMFGWIFLFARMAYAAIGWESDFAEHAREFFWGWK